MTHLRFQNLICHIVSGKGKGGRVKVERLSKETRESYVLIAFAFRLPTFAKKNSPIVSFIGNFRLTHEHGPVLDRWLALFRKS